MKLSDNKNTITSTELLLTRQSNANLTFPPPNEVDLDIILRAGMRVPDHAGLMPWQFLIAVDDGLQRLSNIFVDTLDNNERADPIKLAKTTKMPFRAPMIIIVTTDYQTHEKVPHKEQLITAGCCVHAMQMAAFSLGYGAMWRTGNLATNEQVKQAMAIDTSEDIVGFLYVGTQSKCLNVKSEKAYQSKVRYI